MVPTPGILTDGEETEADLDVEWSGAVAKGATVDFVVSESTETTAGIDLSALYIIDNNLAPVMSESYGACEATLGAGRQCSSTTRCGSRRPLRASPFCWRRGIPAPRDATVRTRR